MQLRILGCGTSTGVPVPACKCAICTSEKERNIRTRTSAVISNNSGSSILIDTSTDFRVQALRWKVPRVDAVCYTHYHSDHILGLEDLRGYNYAQKSRIPVYGTKETITHLKKCFEYVFFPDPNYHGGGVAQVDAIEFEELQPLQIVGIELLPFPLKHGGINVTGYRVGEMAYATDCNIIPSESLEVLKGVRYLVLDGLRYEPHPAHLTIPEAIEIAKTIGAERTILTHMTHTIDYDEVSAKLPSGVELAFDGMLLDFEG